MRLGVIGVASLVLALMTAAALHAPMHASGYRSPPTPMQREEQYRQKRLLSGYQQYLRELGKEPLEWQCHAGAADRLRVVDGGCLTEFIVEYSLDERHPGVILQTQGEGSFRYLDGSTKGSHALTGADAERIRNLLIERLPGLPTQIEGMSMPRRELAIEACIDGHSSIVLRHTFDEPVERLASRLLDESGLRAEFPTSYRCL